MHRIVLERNEVVKMCEMNKVSKIVRNNPYIYHQFDYRGSGNKEHVTEVFEVHSKKTGKISRLVDAYPVEIKGMSPLFYLFYVDREFRKSEVLINRDTGKVCNLTPIGRESVMGYVIYGVEEI